MPNDVELKIGADGAQAEAAFDKVAGAGESAGQRIQQALREASYNMASSVKGATESMSASFAKVNSMMIAFTAILGGGAAFKAAIGSTVDMTVEAVKMGKQLGISASEASVLKVALGSVHVESETFMTANQKMTKTLGSNEGAFKNLGVATRDSNGNFRNSLDIQLDVNTALLKFKEGTDRNIESQKIYGKGWAQVQESLKLTTPAMVEAHKKAEALGLVIGTESVAATDKYRTAMANTELVLQGMEKAVGNALLPILTDLGEWFDSVGPYAVQVMRGAIADVAAVFYGLKMVVEVVWEAIKMFIQIGTVSLLAFADAVDHALHFDFAGAKAAWRAGAETLTAEFGESLDRLVTKAEANRDRIVKLWDDTKDTPIANEKGGGGSNSGSGKDKSEIGEWKAQLEAKHEAGGNYFKTSLADDEAFWQKKAVLAKGNAEDEAAVAHELFAIHQQLAVQRFTVEQDALKADMAASRAGSMERITLAVETAQHVGATYGYKSAQYMASLKDIKKAEDEFEKDQQKQEEMKVARARDHSLAMIGMERDQLTARKNLGQISATEEIAQLKVLTEREYQIEVQALNDKLALMKAESPEKQQVLDALAKLQDKHDAKMAQLNIQSAEAIQKNWTDMLKGVGSAFDQSITGMIRGTQTWQKSLANIGQAIESEFVTLGMKRVSTWVGNEMAMLFASKAKDTAVGAGSEAAAWQAMSAKKGEAAAVIPAEAAEAAGGAASAVAAIPIVGPGLATAAYASMMAMVMGGLGVASSAGGEWQVPADRLNFVHKNETILPAHEAGQLRDMVAGGGSTRGGNITLNINANDAQSVQRLFTQNGSAIIDAIRRQARGFNV